MHPVPDLPVPRQSLEDLRGLSRDLELLVRAVRDLVALHAALDAGLRRPAGHAHERLGPVQTIPFGASGGPSAPRSQPVPR